MLQRKVEVNCDVIASVWNRLIDKEFDKISVWVLSSSGTVPQIKLKSKC